MPDERASRREPEGSRATDVKSVGRAVELLRCVVAAGRQGRRLTDLAAGSRLSKSTTHRMLAALIANGLVEQDGDDRRFRPGIELFRLGAAAAECFSLVDAARPALMRLAQRTGDTVFLSVPTGHHSLCVDRRVGTFPIKALTVEIGDRRPLGIGSGSLALLASRPDHEVEAALSANAAEHALFANFDAERIRKAVAATRRRGYALIEGQLVAGMSAVGVPLLDRRGRAIAALSVAAISTRLQGRRRLEVVAMLRQQAHRLERRLVTDPAEASRLRLAS